MIALADQIKDIAGGDLASNAGIIAQIGSILTNEGYDIAGVKVDLVTEQSHESTVTATSHPIEYGANITDHIYANANVVTVSGIISDLEIGNFADVGLIGFAGKVKGLATGDESTKSSQSWKRLKEIQRSGQLIKLVTELQDYENMAIISMSTKQDKDSNTEVRFTMNLREIFIVGSQRYSGNVADLQQQERTKPPEKRNPPGKSETSRAANNQDTSDRLASEKKLGQQPGQKATDGSYASKLFSAVRSQF